MSRRRALVFGGTGTVGREVLRGLAAAGLPTVFTYRRSRERALALASEFSQRALEVDLADPAATRALVRSLDERPDVLVHCAGTARAASCVEVGDAEWLATQSVTAHAPFIACQELFGSLPEGGEGHAVLVGALERTQSFPVPAHFAASQGMLSGLASALAKELGSRGVRVNMVALGVLEGGLSGELDARVREDFRAYSALRRFGRASEAARAILWLALENTLMTGRVLAVNGGI